MMFLVFFGAALAGAFRFTMRMPPRRTPFVSFMTMSLAHIVYTSPIDNIAMTTLWGFSACGFPTRQHYGAQGFPIFPWVVRQ